jgi:hypothetical protein
VGVLPQIPILIRAHVGELDLRACVEGGGQDVDHASGEDDPSHECLDDKEDVTIEAQCGDRGPSTPARTPCASSSSRAALAPGCHGHQEEEDKEC